MALSQRLEIRQGQSLVMTPHLLQAIKLLQLSHLDLAAYVDAELERNPLLERMEAEGHEAGEARGEAGEARAGDAAEGGDGFEGEPQVEPWLAQDLNPSRSEIEDELGTRL